MALVNYMVYVKANDETLIFRLDKDAGEAIPIGVETAPGRIVEYARLLEAWANKQPIPLEGTAAELFAGMREVCPTGATIAINETEASILH
ncbi:hypothetical protein E2C06_34435 [Dankookia rubra]|uniref:Uncharacterized protein n=1 Tax=Dankookia rubra TaxID=1442381 RepID=A0A4R5Q5V3_9PROT|nr:hypothetical protein [Dankookia rubra]TDH58086.1 hypothetical protein E2C06_34435 [Dankookia rubra]